MNSQISSRRPLAQAALLMVLSASAVLAQVTSVPFKGSFEGRGTGVVQNDGTLLGEASGAGTASLIGRFTYTLKATVVPPGLSVGVFQLVAANGDVISGSFVGRGVPTDTPNVWHIIELMTITGGTGRFQGATGNFTFDRLADLSNLPAFDLHSGSIKGTISTPGSAK